MKNLVVVDIQPCYQPWFHSNLLSELAKLLESAKNIIWYYNGPDVGVDDSDNCIIDMMIDYVNEEILQSITFIEKGYGFLRDWMDNGVEDAEIIKALRKNDDCYHNEYGEIYIPPYIEKPNLKSCYICGGGDQQCLKEMEILFKYWKIQTKRINSAIY